MGGVYHFVILFGTAVVFTAISYFLAVLIVAKKRAYWQSTLIGLAVVLLGYVLHTIKAPFWLVMSGPMPIGFAGAWLIMRDGRRAVLAYVLTWAIYIAFHLILSGLFNYDLLVPGWHISFR